MFWAGWYPQAEIRVDFTHITLPIPLKVKRVNGTHAMKKTTKATAARNLIGSRIRQARLKCSPRVSQEDLAGRLAARSITIDRSAVSRIENGTRYLMDYEVAAIARSLKVTVAWLFGEPEHGR